MNPYVIKDRTQAAETFCKIEPDQLQEVTQQFTFHEHSSQEVAWFTACRANDVQFVRQNLKNFANLTDQR